jgi:hypothetical protein
MTDKKRISPIPASTISELPYRGPTKRSSAATALLRRPSRPEHPAGDPGGAYDARVELEGEYVLHEADRQSRRRRGRMQAYTLMRYLQRG